MSRLSYNNETFFILWPNFPFGNQQKRKSSQEGPLCGLLANIKSATANMGQSVICV